MKNLVISLFFFLSLTACKKDEPAVTCADAGPVFSTSKDAVVSMNLYLEDHGSLYLPSFAVWTEKAGTVKTLFVTCKAAFRSWDGTTSRKEALPVWFGRNIVEVSQPEVFEVDAVTTATPSASPFILLVDFLPLQVNDTLSIFVEVNASYDKNEYYRDEINGQPSVIWRARVYNNPEGHISWKISPSWDTVLSMEVMTSFIMIFHRLLRQPGLFKRLRLYLNLPD